MDIDKIIDEEIERFLAEAQPTSAHHIVRKMMDLEAAGQPADALTAMMNLLDWDMEPDDAARKKKKDEATNWLKRNTQDIQRAQRELGYRPGAGLGSPTDMGRPMGQNPFGEGKSIHTAVKLRIAEVDGLDEKKKRRKRSHAKKLRAKDM